MITFASRSSRPDSSGNLFAHHSPSRRIADDVLQLIGGTPLVRVRRISAGLKCEVLAKLEYLNPGGSVKDRIGVAMIEAAEKEGLIKPGYTLIEPTSGNTGIGLALAAAVMGYKIIFTVPDKMSKEKIEILRAFGARVVITPTAVPPDHPANNVKLAEKMAKETPRAFMLNQYFNSANPLAHYSTTGPEIWDQTDGKVDVLVAGMGTGGTITGTARYLKEKDPEVEAVGVDPEGSMFHHAFYDAEGEVHPYRVEGIGEDFMPSTLDLKLVDRIITVHDRDAFLMARRLTKEEGMFAGGSSGAAMVAALEVAKELEGGRVVVILPDTGRNYLTRIYSDEWMQESGFLESREERIPVSDILRVKPGRRQGVVAVSPEDSIRKAVRLMRQNGFSQMPVLKDGVQVGSVRELWVMKALASGEARPDQRVGGVMKEPFPSLKKDDTILNPFALLKEKGAAVVNDGEEVEDIVTTADVADYLARAHNRRARHRRDGP